MYVDRAPGCAVSDRRQVIVNSEYAVDQPLSTPSVARPTRPPGWYLDGSRRERWWDGSEWTLHVRGGPVITPATNRRADRPKALRRLQRGSSNTLASWIIAISPLIQLGVHVTAYFVGGYVTWVAVGAIVALMAGTTAVLAWYDGEQLETRGYGKTASPYWALLAPSVYLFVRGQRTSLRNFEGYGPLWGHLLVVFLLAAAYVLLTLFGGAFAQFVLLPR